MIGGVHLTVSTHRQAPEYLASQTRMMWSARSRLQTMAYLRRPAASIHRQAWRINGSAEASDGKVLAMVNGQLLASAQLDEWKTGHNLGRQICSADFCKSS